MGEEQKPLGLPRIQSLCRADVFQVLVVGPDLEGCLRPLQPVVPLLQHHLDRQQFSVADVIVSFCGGQTPREEGTGMGFLVGG